MRRMGDCWPGALPTTKSSKTRRGADAAVRARVQRAMEHPSSQSGAPASPHMIILALAMWLRRW